MLLPGAREAWARCPGGLEGTREWTGASEQAELPRTHLGHGPSAAGAGNARLGLSWRFWSKPDLGQTTCGGPVRGESPSLPIAQRQVAFPKPTLALLDRTKPLAQGGRARGFPFLQSRGFPDGLLGATGSGGLGDCSPSTQLPPTVFYVTRTLSNIAHKVLWLLLDLFFFSH